MEGQLPPETITLPKSGGTVWFRDIEDISSDQYMAIRDMAIQLRRREVQFSPLGILGMQYLITKWDIPGLPNLPIPGSEDGLKMDSYRMVHWRDVRAIEEALLPALSQVALTSAEEQAKNGSTPPLVD